MVDCKAHIICPMPEVCAIDGLCIDRESAAAALSIFHDLRIGKLVLNQGDIMVCKVPRNVSNEVMGRIAEHLNHMVKSSGFNNRVLVIHDDFDLSIITKAEIEEKAK